MRTTRRKNRDGSEVVYYQLAESVWNPAKRRAEVKVAYNFGRADQVDVEALRRLSDSIRRVCEEPAERGQAAGPAGRLSEALEVLPAKSYGGMYVINALWERVGVGPILCELMPKRRGHAPHEVAIRAMVANRLLAPCSKLGCYDTWLPREVYFPEGSSLKLSQFYAAMDFLAAHAEVIEKDLFFSVADLFSLDVDIIFFDTTTAHFEIDDEDEDDKAEAELEEPIEGAKRKRGRDSGAHGNPEVVIALAVTRDGLPVRSWVFPGNTADVTLVGKVREDLKGWRLSRCIFVGDAGMYSAENRKLLARGLGRYLLAVPLRKVKEVREDVLSRAGRYREVSENLSVKEVVVGEGEAHRRYFLCLNRREAEREKRRRERKLAMLKAEIEALESQKEAHPRRACLLLASKRFSRYLTKDKTGRLCIDHKKVEAEERFDGKWVVITNDDSLSAEDGALGYKAAMIIEACFRRMKMTGLKLRPMFHWTEKRIIAHVKLCVLALLLQRVAEIRCGESWRRIRSALQQIQAVPCETPNGFFIQRTRPPKEALTYLEKFKIQPPPKLIAITPTT